jgi:hypothetical protein
MTDSSDIPNLQEELHCFEAASGATVNIHKSRTIAVGNWNTSLTVMNIPYYDTTTILSFQTKSIIRESASNSWTKTTAKIRTQAQENYCRMTTLR